MLVNVTCGKCLSYWWTFATCGISITSLVVVVRLCLTGTVVNSRLHIGGRTNRTVNVFNVTSFHGRLIDSFDQLTGVNDVNSFRCFEAKTAGITFPICAYEDPNDIWVSKSFNFGGYWERQYVDRFINLLRRYPDMEFVDLGANIGTFTLPAARVTHVVAVEPYSRSMARLLKSVQLGGVAQNVSLVFNAISNQRSTYTFGFETGNVGGTYLKTQKPVDTTIDCGGELCARTILLDDLLPLMRRRRAVMKVDIEGHQPRVFTDSAAAKFFDVIDVPLIFMEWKDLCRSHISSQVSDLVRFFSKRQFHVFAENTRRLGADCSQWTNDVIFAKQSLVF